MTASCKPTADSASGTAPAPACTLVIFGAGGDLTKRLGDLTKGAFPASST